MKLFRLLFIVALVLLTAISAFAATNTDSHAVSHSVSMICMKES
ncbi:MAG: hypothetical protein PWQ96_1817 [Clostridia bacterium]|jgi:hypothetical protein|nr:hypothetical protein [Clostridiales bacterium]MDK2986173.1 hypothetical protein [Clostridia bacterium]